MARGSRARAARIAYHVAWSTLTESIRRGPTRPTAQASAWTRISRASRRRCRDGEELRVPEPVDRRRRVEDHRRGHDRPGQGPAPDLVHARHPEAPGPGASLLGVEILRELEQPCLLGTGAARTHARKCPLWRAGVGAGAPEGSAGGYSALAAGAGPAVPGTI